MSSTRVQTRDRLLDKGLNCNCSSPAPIMPISVFEDSMYKVVYNAGFEGTKDDFKEALVSALTGAENNLSTVVVQKPSRDEFPENGDENIIYIDTEKKHIYFWNKDQYYRIDGENSGEDGDMIPSDGLTYEGGEI